VWEIAEEKQSDGKPFKMGKTYNLSTNAAKPHGKKLRIARGELSMELLSKR
jgi:hypothetical protein